MGDELTLERVRELREKSANGCLRFDEMVGAAWLDRCAELDAILAVCERALLAALLPAKIAETNDAAQ